MSHVPNILTLLRIGASPVLILLLKNEQYALALWICALAGITDALDGYIAKTFRCESRFGAILDPIADKILITSVVVMLAVNGVLPFWLLLVIVFRDLLIVGGWMLLTLLNTEVTIRPSLISKSNTVFQILLMLALIMDNAGVLSLPTGLTAALIAVVVVTTVLSGIHYVWVWGFKRPIDESTERETPVSRSTSESISPARGRRDRVDPGTSGSTLVDSWQSDKVSADLDRS